MSWDDKDYGIEFAQFLPTSYDDTVDPRPNLHVLYCQIHWDTIQDYTNQWNKNRKRVLVNEIRREFNPEMKKYDTISEIDCYLDMGARLYNTLRKLEAKRPKYVKIWKDFNPKDKFDTWYKAEAYKLKPKPKTKLKAEKKD